MPVALEFDQAFRWNCPECGTKNYTGWVENVPSREKQREIAISWGIINDTQDLDSEESIVEVSPPSTVTCVKCGHSADATPPEHGCFAIRQVRGH